MAFVRNSSLNLPAYEKLDQPAKNNDTGRSMFVSEIMAAVVIIIGLGTMMSEDFRPNR
jgi:hypothetical protein